MISCWHVIAAGVRFLGTQQFHTYEEQPAWRLKFKAICNMALGPLLDCVTRVR